MDSYELLRFAAVTLECIGVRYLVTGSMAMMTHGEARFTNDVDIVADLQSEHAGPLVDAFRAPEYYCSKEAVNDAKRQAQPDQQEFANAVTAGRINSSEAQEVA